MIVQSLYETWIEVVRRTKARSTHAGYERAMRLHWLPYLGLRDARTITRLDIRGTIRHVLLQHDLEPESVRSQFIALSAFFRSLQLDEVITQNPCRDAAFGLLPRRKAPPIPLTESERDSFLVAAKIVTPNFHDCFTLMAFAGTRPGETLGLQWADIDWRERRAHLQRSWRDGIGPVKNDAPRRIDLNRTVLEMLERRYADRTDSVWVHPSSQRALPYDQTTLDRAMRAVKIAAGITKPWTPHTMRHTFATLLLEAGAELWYLQAQLGHASIQITRDLYAHSAQPVGHKVDLLDERRRHSTLSIVPHSLRAYRRMAMPQRP